MKGLQHYFDEAKQSSICKTLDCQPGDILEYKMDEIT
ncbi:TPA: helix-turn-helix domain-containing protein [Bacillus cereus]